MTKLELVANHTLAEDAEAGINHTALDVCYDSLCNILQDSALDVEKNTGDLSINFTSLADATGVQAAILDKLSQTVSKLEHESGEVTMEHFMLVMSDSISSTISKIVSIAENAMDLSFVMEGVIEQLADINKFLTQVNKINSQTRMLALNATIEAARAGEAGNCFGVVAREVKQVSGQIDEMAKGMQQQIGSISDKVHRGQETLAKVAGIDMSANIAAREEIDMLLSALIKQSMSISSIMQESSQSVKDISAKIGGITVSMQFQDRNSQIITNMVALIRAMRDHERDPKANPLPTDPAAALEKISSVLSLSAMRQRLFAVGEQHGIALKKSQMKAPVASSADDIELF
jgi:methyl-accepting chemotaxis protein